MSDGIRRTGTIKLATSLSWLAVAATFAHLATSSMPRSAPDLRFFLAASATLVLVLAASTWSNRTRLVQTVSAAASVATVLVSVALIALGRAHETGGVLLAGGALIAIMAVARRSTDPRVAAISDSDAT
jgi:hypothetical protein